MAYTLWFSQEFADDMTGTNERWGLNQGYIIVVDTDGALHQVTTVSKNDEPLNFDDYHESYVLKLSFNHLSDIKVLVKASGEVDRELAALLKLPPDVDEIKKHIKNFYEPDWTPQPYRAKRPNVKIRINKKALRPEVRRHA